MGHKGKGKKFLGRRGQRFYTKSKNKEQEGWYVRTRVFGGIVGMCCGSLGWVVHSAQR